MAKWHFEIRPGETEQSEPSEFGMTRTDGYKHIMTGLLAPGTFGEIPIYVDTTGTEVLTRLDLTLKITDCPRNIKFYTNANKEKQLKFTQTEEDGKYVTEVPITKYYSIDELADDYVNQVHNETIYWNWEWETDDEDQTIDEADEKDSEDNGKTAQIVITAVGTEVLEKVDILAECVQIGDYVDYNPGNYTITKSELNDLAGVTLKSDLSTTGNATTQMLAQVASTEDTKIAAITSSTKWKVLDIDNKTGIVKIVPEAPTASKVNIWAEGGYKNAIIGLDRVAAIYGHGYGAIEAKSLTVEDVNKLTGVDVSQYDSDETFEYGAGTFVKEDENGNLTTINVVSGDNITMEYIPTTRTKSTNYPYQYDFTSNIINYGTWLASRSITCNDTVVFYNIRYINGGRSVRNAWVWNPLGSGSNDYDRQVTPVVYLKPGLGTTGKNENNAWKLK